MLAAYNRRLALIAISVVALIWKQRSTTTLLLATTSEDTTQVAMYDTAAPFPTQRATTTSAPTPRASPTMHTNPRPLLATSKQPNETSPLSPTDQSSINNCQWTVITGDSNNRNAFAKWIDLEQQDPSSQIRKAQRAKGNSTCSWWWADDEIVVWRGQHCHIVTLKFIAKPSKDIPKLYRLLDFSNPHCPKKELRTPALPSNYQRPAFPTTLWFSHGLWELPNQGVLTSEMLSDTYCSKRFASHIEVMNFYKSKGVRLVWQTLFPVNHHPTIRNSYLKWDYRCQLHMAQKHGLAVRDLYKRVHGRASKLVEPNNFHLKDGAFLLRYYLKMCCGGWDSYWNKKKLPRR